MSTKFTRRSVTAGLALGALATPGLGVRPRRDASVDYGR